jgi:hypothetical protein
VFVGAVTVNRRNRIRDRSRGCGRNRKYSRKSHGRSYGRGLSKCGTQNKLYNTARL